MKSIKLVLIAALAVFAFQNCSTTKYVATEQLANKWILKSINNRDVAEAFPAKKPYMVLNFDIDQVSGNGGCNTFTGKFTYHRGKFKAPNLASTMMACTGDQEESTFFQLLGKPSKLSLLNGNLIFSQDSKPVLIFSRAQPLSAVDLASTWVLQSMNGKSMSEEPGQKIPTALFNVAEGRVSGNTGCNNFNAHFSLNKNVLEVASMITTRMACEKMDRENEFVKTFNGRIDVDMENDMLILRKDNKIIMTFSKQ